jgi:hypothetical protein
MQIVTIGLGRKNSAPTIYSTANPGTSNNIVIRGGLEDNISGIFKIRNRHMVRLGDKYVSSNIWNSIVALEIFYPKWYRIYSVNVTR